MPGSPADWVAVLDRLLAGDELACLEVSRLVTGVLQQLRAWDFRDEWDDLRQEVLLSIIDNARAGRLRDPQAFLAYTRTITRNKVIDRVKRRLRHKERDTLPWDDETARGFATPPPDPETAALWSAVRDLPGEEQRVVEGVFVHGKTYQQVSDDTGIPLGTMKRRLRDAVQALRRRLAET